MRSDVTTVKMPLPDQVIAGRYRIVSRLGSGGMGLVFLAEQVGVGNKVALKFLDPEPSDDDSRIARFLREAKVGLEVQHPNAAQILDLGRDEHSRLFLCFELVEGEDLRDLLKREGRLTFPEARDVALQVAQVLAFAHDRGIVHRDVKPENIRVRRDLAGVHVKVLDFGIARLLRDAGVRLTAEGMLAGTPRYMAPEQVRDEPIDGRVDQYALGLVFFEMLTGAIAMAGKNVSQILLHQIQTLVPPLAWVDPQLGHADVDAFIARACAKSPSDRFASMAEFVRALQALEVDARAWPPPRPPPASSSSTAPTRDGRVPEVVGTGESDTFVREPQRTELERRVEVPTDPERAPVARTAAAPVHEVPELPTEPERPAVSRRAPTVPARGVGPSRPAIAETVMGTLKPPAPPKKRSALPLVVGLVLAAVVAVALVLLRR
ncbi:MAG: protein kinase domain-containing protein [Myxococcota bacterium]